MSAASAPDEKSPSDGLAGSALAPLRYPLFRNMWIANTAANFGVYIKVVAASWLMASLTGSAEMVALVSTANALPIMLLSLIAGAIADNYDRRRVMLCAQTFMLLAAGLMAIMGWIGALTPHLLLGLTFVIACGNAFSVPSWQASVGEMVTREHLTRAVTLNSMGANLARAAGPGVGGVIVAATGAAAAFAVNAFTYIGLIVVLMRWRPEQTPRLLPPERIDVAMGAGFRYVAMSPSLRAVLLRGIAFGFAAAALQALMPLVARDLVGGGPLTYGFLLAAFGIGGVSGGLAGHRLRRNASNEALVRGASIAFGTAAVVIGLTGSLLIALPMLVIAGAAWILVISSLNVTVQMTSPRWVVGRSLAIYRMSIFAGMAAGSWIWGIVAENETISVALCFSALAQSVCLLIGLRRPLAQNDHLDLSPLQRWTEPQTLVPIEPQSGPIVVSIEYRIREEDIMPFLAIMSERRRIRLRDGARHWTLLRDLGEEDLWVERYHASTWVEYVRHNQRRTHDDAGIPARIRTLHQRPDAPVVTRMIECQTGSLPVDDTVPERSRRGFWWW